MSSTVVDDLVDKVVAHKLRLLFYDIETAPMLAFAWQAKTDWIGHHQIESGDRFLLCWSAKWSDGTEVVSGRVSQKEAKGQDDSRIVNSLSQLMQEADYVVAHNGNRFDYKRVNARLLLNKLPPMGDVQMIDTLQIARSSFDLPYNNLNYLAQVLGYGSKIQTTFDLWRRAFYGEVSALKEMEAYNRQDVILLEHVFHAMKPYAKRLPRLVDAAEWRDELCPYCGSRERRKLSRPYRTGVNNFPRYKCQQCQRTYRGWQATGTRKMGTVGI